MDRGVTQFTSHPKKDFPVIFLFASLFFAPLQLLATVRQRVRPRLHVFGHIHDNPGQWTDGATTFVNAAACDRKYRPVQAPVLVDIEVPRGRTKEHVLKTVAEFKG
jgi:hypothetical protein